MMLKRWTMFLGGVLALSAVNGAQAVNLTVDCGTGTDFTACQRLVGTWAKRTGNTVKAVRGPNSSAEKLGLFQQSLAAKDDSLDVYQLDVVWPGLLGQHFVDLRRYLPKAEIDQHFPAIIKNNTYRGKLVAMPWYTDAGVLYYRTDLLRKYGFGAPPKTWGELASMAQKIQAGERRQNPKFVGFVFQGKNSESLTCNAVEWVESFGGGPVVDASGKITVNNPGAVAALRAAAGWVGTIAPSAVTTYGEEEARNVWQAGNAAFMRNWPYAYALGQSEGSRVRGKIGLAPLPAGPGGQASATLGGWNVGVSAYSGHPREAADLVRYLTGREVQKARAIQASQPPTIRALYQDPEVLKAQPFLGNLYGVLTGAVARPSTATRTKYNAVSSAFATATYNVLTKKQTPQAALGALQGQLARLKGRGW